MSLIWPQPIPRSPATKQRVSLPLAQCVGPQLADIVAKVFSGCERKFLEPPMRFTRGDARDHIASSKTITDLRSGVEKQRGGGEVQRSTFARFLGLFDFRLLQQYLPKAEVYPQQSVQPATRHPSTLAQQAPRRLGTTRTRTDADGSRAIRNGRFQRPVPQLRRQKHQS